MRKTFILIFIAASLFFTVPVQASAYSDVLGELMTLIEQEYVGGEITEDDLYEAALIGLSAVLDDYSYYMDDETYNSFSGDLSGRLFGIGVQYRMNELGQAEIVRVFNGSPAEAAGLKRQDIIISINGESAEGKTLDEIEQMIANPLFPTAEIEYMRNGINTAVKITKGEIKSLTVYTEPLESITGVPADDICYINMTGFSETTANDLKTLIAKLKAEGYKKMILDMRSNGGGHLMIAEEICEMLVPEGPSYHTINRRGRLNSVYSGLKELPFENVVVLVDKNTASAAELLSAAMQDAGSGIIVGETTYGKGVVQTIFNLPTGGAFKLTTEEYFRRSGEKVDGIGVIPDYAVAMPAADYETPSDLMLLKAVELLED